LESIVGQRSKLQDQPTTVRNAMGGQLANLKKDRDRNSYILDVYSMYNIPSRRTPTRPEVSAAHWA